MKNSFLRGEGNMNGIRFFAKNQINQAGFKICFAVLALISVSGMVMGYVSNYHRDLLFVRSAADNFLLASTDSRAIRMIFGLLFPLLASSLCTGCRKEEGLFPMLRMTRKQYVYGNAIVVVVITVFAFMVLLGLNQLLCFAAFPPAGADNRWGMPEYALLQNVHPDCLFDIWNAQNPYVYNMLYTVIISVLAGGIACLTYGLGYTKIFGRLKPVPLSVLVFVLFMALFVLGELLHIPVISILSYVEQGHSVSVMEYIIFTSCIYLSGLFLAIRGRKAYEPI